MKNTILLVCAVLLAALSLVQAADKTAGFTLPAYQKTTLENNLTLYLMEQHEVPLIYVVFVTPSGAVKDGEKYGLASLTGDGLLFGTNNYSKKEIENQLEFLGVRYGVSTSAEDTRFEISFLKKDFDKVMPIFKEIVRFPTFDEQEFEKRKVRLLSELEQAKEHPRRVIGAYFNKFLFGEHPYGNPTDGTLSSVGQIVVTDLRSFYQQNYRPSSSAIAAAGDFSSDEIKNQLVQLFGDWQGDEQPVGSAAQGQARFDRSRVLLVNKEAATETQFLIGSFGIERKNPDYVAVRLINTVLGGRFTSWLNDELRVNRGLTYGAYSSFNARKQTGTFYISSFTKTETTVEAIDVALEVLARLHDSGVSEDVLSSAKNYMKGQFPPDYETSGDLADFMCDMFIYDFNESYINDFEKNVDSVTAESARQIIDKYFPRDNMQLVLIGKASAIKEGVSKYGELTEKEIDADGF
ncbi:peptidase M16 [candidate division KSB1 bacterium RBG_16_48_16]|nr:MAG: peptidase M16 [candidate division KSB1 bacterium RBG_16_48_16]